MNSSKGLFEWKYYLQSLKMYARWRSYVIMKIHWWWNLHNCHRHSCCGRFCSRFNATIKQEVRGRSRKLLWVASILGACWPGKLRENVSGWLFQASENVPWRRQSHSTLDKSKNVSRVLRNQAAKVILCVVSLSDPKTRDDEVMFSV